MRSNLASAISRQFIMLWNCWVMEAAVLMVVRNERQAISIGTVSGLDKMSRADVLGSTTYSSCARA